MKLDLEDERVEAGPLGVNFRGSLDDTQQKAVNAMLAHDAGVLRAPPGWGKTVAAAN